MADRHTILVRVRRGEVAQMLFCDCCPAVTVEVRQYVEPSNDAGMPASLTDADALPAAAGLHRDDVGTYSRHYYEPEDDDVV